MAHSDKELGPCTISYGTLGAEADIGGSLGVTVSLPFKYGDLKDDQNGEEPVDQIITGQGALIEVTMTDLSFANLAMVINQTVRTSGLDKAIAVKNLVGTRMSTLAKSIILKKMINGVASTDENDWIRARSAAPTPETLELAFDGTTQRTIKARFVCLPDSQGYRIIFGKQSIAS